MDIYRSAVGMNISVREDCVVSEPAISFLFPFGKISSKKSKTGVTFSGAFCDNTSEELCITKRRYNYDVAQYTVIRQTG